MSTAAALFAVQGVSNYLGQRKLGKEKEAFFGGVEREGLEAAGKAEKARSQFGVGPTYRKFLQYAMQDPTADFQRQQAARQAATGTEALKSGGARAILGGLGAQQQMSSDIMSQIGAAEFGRKSGALAQFGAVEQRVAEQKLADARGDLSLARQQVASGKQGAFEGKMQKQQALANAVSQSAGLGAQSFMAKNGMKLPGQFSHKSNPIDLMQGGSKIGEATGDEYVINPEQARKIAEQSKYASMLFKKFDNNAK